MCPRLGRPTDSKKTERFEVVKRGIQLVAEKASEE